MIRRRNMLSLLARAERLKALIPVRLKTALVGYLRADRYMCEVWARAAPFPGIEEVSSYRGKVDVRLGIFKSYNFWHQYYAAACRELEVPYCTIDIGRADWMAQVESSGCSAFLVWPTPSLSVWKQMYDERLAALSKLAGKVIYPELHAMLIYESKRRMHYWLSASGVPHPETWIFYDRDEAMQFAESAALPIVIKTDLGAAASGVRILRHRSELKRAVRIAFGRGLVRKRADRRDRQWGNVLFQRFIPEASEWRIIRIGESYFGYEKLRVGDFHSGTAQWRYVRPPEELLNLTRSLTDHGRFTSMSVDILVDPSGKFYVNELQAVFGMLKDYACIVDGRAGRMRYNATTGTWYFEEGDFCRNRMCNLRVQVVLDMLGYSCEGR